MGSIPAGRARFKKNGTVYAVPFFYCCSSFQTQRGNHLEEHPWGLDIPGTIRLALDSLTFHFQEAVDRGYEPIEEWMIANPWMETMSKFF
ncbi:hypothetical protein LJC19_03625 [Oxalobacter sp. OttesenSCG-928-P03]|nr:hypothetical protein [Oxalobacter sp. OttesenSCG-928-P03]